MDLIDKEIIDALIKETEEEHPLVDVVNEYCHKCLDIYGAEYVSNFTDLFKKILSISVKQVENTDYYKFDITKDEAIRTVTARNLYEILTEHSFQEYLDYMEKQVLDQQQEQAEGLEI